LPAARLLAACFRETGVPFILPILFPCRPVWRCRPLLWPRAHRARRPRRPVPPLMEPPAASAAVLIIDSEDHDAASSFPAASL